MDTFAGTSLGGGKRAPWEQDADTLRELYERYSEEHEIKPGDLLQWKEGLKNKRYPDYGQPVVVVEIHPGKRCEIDDNGTPYYNEPLDVALGVMNEDGDFCVYHADIKRFEPYKR